MRGEPGDGVDKCGLGKGSAVLRPVQGSDLPMAILERDQVCRLVSGHHHQVHHPLATTAKTSNRIKDDLLVWSLDAKTGCHVSTQKALKDFLFVLFDSPVL